MCHDRVGGWLPAVPFGIIIVVGFFAHEYALATFVPESVFAKSPPTFAECIKCTLAFFDQLDIGTLHAIDHVFVPRSPGFVSWEIAFVHEEVAVTHVSKRHVVLGIDTVAEQLKVHPIEPSQITSCKLSVSCNISELMEALAVDLLSFDRFSRFAQCGVGKETQPNENKTRSKLLYAHMFSPSAWPLS